MKFRLCLILLAVLIISFPTLAETEDTKEDNSPKIKRSIWQRVFPRAGDIEGTVHQGDTDMPLVAAEVRIVETGQHEITDENGAFQFTEIPVGTYTLFISHPTYSPPTEIVIKIGAGETLRGRFYPGAAVPFVNTTDSGDIDGHVYSQTTGKPLAEAAVRIVEIDRLGQTDTSGNFQFRGITPGTYTLLITHATYKTPTTMVIEVTADDTAQVKIYLGTVVRLETVVVEGQRLPPTISRQEIRGSEMIRIPGTGRDALGGLTTLPSIGIPNDLFGILYIRGSAPGNTRLYLDRTPLGYPFHYGGFFSTINSDSIEDIQIYAGGYGAEFGLDAQSIIDIRSRERLKKKWAGVLDLNIVSPSGLLEAKIGDKGYASIAGRFTTFNHIIGLFVDWTFPSWSDYQLKFAYQLTEKHHLTLNGLGAIDHFDFSNIGSEETEDTPDFSAYFKNGFEAEGIHLRSYFTDALTSHLSLTRSHNFLNINFGRDPSQIDNATDEEFIYNVKVNTPTYTLREDVVYKLTPTLQFEPGFLLAFSPAESLAHTSQIENINFDDETFTSKKTFDEFNYGFRRIEGYLQGRYDPLSFLSVALGVRFDYLNLTEELSIQPRGSLSFTLPTTSILRFAYGRYEQSPLAYQVLKTDGNRDLKSSIAEHYVMELEHELSPQTEFKAALYYKDLKNLVTRSVNADAFFDGSGTPVTTAYLNQGTGFVNGAELFLRHRVSEKFFGWISYAYIHAEQRETPSEVYKPFLFDNTHIVSIVANYSPTTTTEIGLKWQYANGTSAVPLNTLLMIQDPITLGMHPVFSDVAGAIVQTELQTQHRLDMRFSRKRTWWGLPVTAFTEILNVYNSKNKIKFGLPDKLHEELKAIELEEDMEEFPWDLESLEYESSLRFPFNIVAGIIYEF